MEQFDESTSQNEKYPVSASAAEYVQVRGLKGQIEVVPLYGGSRVEVPMDSNPQVLITEHLNGCTATVIITVHDDFTRSAQLVHFSPFFLASHLKKIDSLVSEGDKSALKKEALIYMSENRQENRIALEDHLRSVFGDSITINVATYPEKMPSEYAGTLAVEIPGDSDKPVRYHTA